MPILAGFVLTLPVTFWQIWAFVAPGLYDNERQAILPFIVCSSALFAGGAIFGYALVFPSSSSSSPSWDNGGVVSALDDARGVSA
ncbi:MAG: twin-arginine translocase subunit TatC [Myxococcota bacterium]